MTMCQDHVQNRDPELIALAFGWQAFPEISIALHEANTIDDWIDSVRSLEESLDVVVSDRSGRKCRARDFGKPEIRWVVRQEVRPIQRPLWAGRRLLLLGLLATFNCIDNCICRGASVELGSSGRDGEIVNTLQKLGHVIF